MNEIERAIEGAQARLEAARRHHANSTGNADTLAKKQRQVEIGEITLVALREKAEREKGCIYCDGVPSEYSGIRAEGFYQVAADDIYNPQLEVKFCPACGRRLEAEHESDSV